MSGLKKFKDDLREAGRKNPQLLIKKFEKLNFSVLELAIMKLRYIDGLLIKQIPYEVNIGERWAKKVHSAAIKKTLSGWNCFDLVDLGIHLNATLKTLYCI